MQNQDVRHKNPRKSAQSGNALWFILVAIGLLAALSLTLTRNSGKMADNMDQEQARVGAERIARELTSLTNAIDRLRTVNGCSEEEISFENTVEPGSPTAYENLNAPADKSCHVFDVAGAGLSRNDLPTSYYDTTTYPGPFFPILNGLLSVSGVGPENAIEGVCPANCSELIVITPIVQYDICKQYNMIVGFNTANGGEPILSDGLNTNDKFTGTYGAGTAVPEIIREDGSNGDKDTALYGVTTACVALTAVPMNYVIYKVAIAR